ncbi:hypothetical protein KIN20_011341 [Parelaphostrongylus tenuis]|uniref:Uncharacterized protein n=1 Tax=Parelaphostrongylus tenuis TaxID=148309 RepID=A0AAD5MRZ1_PARTN|nr:hypothetical protein KIN20_011341 [Parelaphostrongylus tenuis]
MIAVPCPVLISSTNVAQKKDLMLNEPLQRKGLPRLLLQMMRKNGRITGVHSNTRRFLGRQIMQMKANGVFSFGANANSDHKRAEYETVAQVLCYCGFLLTLLEQLTSILAVVK